MKKTKNERYYDIQTNRICYLLRPACFYPLAIILILCVLLMVVAPCGVKYDAAIMMMALVFIFILVVLIHAPKKLRIKSNEIIYDQVLYVHPDFSFVKGVHYLRVTYITENAKNIAFEQNFFEKLFNTGHITFEGYAVIRAKRDVHKIRARYNHSVYGIRKFDEVKKKFTFK